MPLNNLRLANFRNYGNLELEFFPKINIFFGANAQGKTNIVEAIFINAVGKSHRGATDADMITLGKDAAKIQLNYSKNDVPNTNEFILSQNSRRRIIKNGKNTTVGNIIGSFNAVLFSPEDLMLIKGAPNLRRKFLDREISQANSSYYHNLCKFTRILTQRNVLLKDIRENNLPVENLDPWDEQYSEYAANITKKRIEAVKKIAELAAVMQDTISDNRENLTVAYEIHGKNEKFQEENLRQWYAEELKIRQKKDIMRGATSIGPQHDDITTDINGMSLKLYGSQGQQRTTVLALKLSELQFLRDETGQYPVLLLDDVMSELDGARRKSLAEFLSEKKIQTIITATDESYFAGWKDIAMWKIYNGTAEKIS